MFESLAEALDTFWGQKVLYVQNGEGFYEVIALHSLSEWCDANEWEISSVLAAFEDRDPSQTAVVMAFDGSFSFFYPSDSETEAPPSVEDPGFTEWAEQQTVDRLQQYGVHGA